MNEMSRNKNESNGTWLICLLSITLIEVKNRIFSTHSLRKKPVFETDYTHFSLIRSLMMMMVDRKERKEKWVTSTLLRSAMTWECFFWHYSEIKLMCHRKIEKWNLTKSSKKSWRCAVEETLIFYLSLLS